MRSSQKLQKSSLSQKKQWGSLAIKWVPQKIRDEVVDVMPINGKLERFHKSLKGEAIRPKTPLCFEDAQRVICQYVKHYNEVRLHSGIGCITPNDRLLNRQEEIFASRKRKLALAKKARMNKNNSKFTT